MKTWEGGTHAPSAPPSPPVPMPMVYNHMYMTVHAASLGLAIPTSSSIPIDHLHLAKVEHTKIVRRPKRFTRVYLCQISTPTNYWIESGYQ